MKIKTDQKIVLVYSALATVSGFVSNGFSGAVYQFLVPAAIYGASLAVFLRLYGKEEKNSIVSNSLVTFLLVWIVVWTFLYNI